MSLFATERAATRTSQGGGPAWMLTEFGAEPYVPDIANVTRLADRNLLSWTYWAGLQLHDPTGGPDEGLLDQLTRRPDPARAAVLARTYPLATAGTPLSQSFDPASGAFAFTYRADHHVHAPTEIMVPVAYHYPHGYAATAHGARITSRPDAQQLTLINEPGASTVTVTIVARTPTRRSPHPSPPRKRVPSPAPKFTG
jgi:endoglycosylceramidase